MRLAVVVVLLVGLAGCAAPPMPSGVPVPQGNATIYVVGRGWHTDIGLPVAELSTPLATMSRDFPGARVLVFGFGERNYLLARNGGSGEMLTALFPSPSAILMTVLNALPAEAFGADNAVALHVSREAADRIAALIWRELETQPGQAAQRLADGPYPGSVFYAAVGTYDAFHTCNTWTAQVLRDAGLPFEPRGVLFADQVMQQARRVAAIQTR